MAKDDYDDDYKDSGAGFGDAEFDDPDTLEEDEDDDLDEDDEDDD